MIIVNATHMMIPHSAADIGTVLRIPCMKGLYIASICKAITIAVAAIRNLFENGFVVKIDLVPDRQFHALNHWNTARVVRDIVHALVISRGAYILNSMSVPTIIGIAMTTVRWSISLSTMYLPGFLNFSFNKFFSFGSIASDMSKNPSVTRLSQMICAGKSGSGSPRKRAPTIVKSSPMLVEKRYRITFLI